MRPLALLLVATAAWADATPPEPRGVSACPDSPSFVRAVEREVPHPQLLRCAAGRFPRRGWLVVARNATWMATLLVDERTGAATVFGSAGIAGRVDITVDPMVTVDLDGDGADEALVVTDERWDGNWYRWLVVHRIAGGGQQLYADLRFGEYQASAQVERGAVVVRQLRGHAGAYCNLCVVGSATFALRDGKFSRVKGKVRGELARYYVR